jgi:FtsP/CotA-like multicopper oxidase with cupredoxin domain
VQERQRVLFRILNASARVHRRVELAGHKFQVTAMDGNPLAAPREIEALELGPAERILLYRDRVRGPSGGDRHRGYQQH